MPSPYRPRRGAIGLADGAGLRHHAGGIVFGHLIGASFQKGAKGLACPSRCVPAFRAAGINRLNANWGDTQMTDGQPHAAGRPAKATLDELEELLGPDILRMQFEKLSGQLSDFLRDARTLAPAELAKESHNVAGAADVLGLTAIGMQLRDCQAAAAGGDMARAHAALDALVPMQKAFEDFVAGY